MNINQIRQQITNHPSNMSFTKRGIEPLFAASKTSKINIIGQAPGIKAQESGVPWDDKSGETLREWLGITDEQFYNPDLFAIMPMDFYYPGKGKTGDLPPRKDFAPLWHPQLLACMPNITLTILIGSYAQQYYLQQNKKRNLTETVQSHSDYLPEYFPIVHPSPLNFRWHSKNPWFKKATIPELKTIVRSIL